MIFLISREKLNLIDEETQYLGFLYKVLGTYNRSYQNAGQFVIKRNKLMDFEMDRWQPIGDPQLRNQIYSAYFDERIENLCNY
jgi:hypothetical protein